MPVPLFDSVTFAEPPIWSGLTVAEKVVAPDAVVPELGAADAAGVGVGDAAGAALARGDADGLGDGAGEAEGLAAARTIAPLNRSAIPAPMACESSHVWTSGARSSVDLGEGPTEPKTRSSGHPPDGHLAAWADAPVRTVREP